MVISAFVHDHLNVHSCVNAHVRAFLRTFACICACIHTCIIIVWLANLCEICMPDDMWKHIWASAFLIRECVFTWEFVSAHLCGCTHICAWGKNGEMSEPMKLNVIVDKYTPSVNLRQLLKNARYSGPYGRQNTLLHEHIPAKNKNIGWKNPILLKFEVFRQK